MVWRPLLAIRRPAYPILRGLRCDPIGKPSEIKFRELETAKERSRWDGLKSSDTTPGYTMGVYE